MLKSELVAVAPLTAPSAQALRGLCLACYSSNQALIINDATGNAICIPCKMDIEGSTK